MSILDEVISYIELDAAEQQLLRELHPRIASSFADITRKFYDAALKNPGSAAVLAGPEQIERLRCTLVEWMASGLLGPYDEAFYEKRSRSGRRHVQIGLQQHYMFTAMNVIRTAYIDKIIELYPLEQACAVVRAVNKLLDAELAIMLRFYQQDSEDKLITRERRMQADKLAAMQTLSSGLAHEVRNPLNAAALQLELLERRLRRVIEDNKLLEPIDLANHELQRLTALLNDFLTFARPPELHTSDQDVVDIVRHVLELEKPLADRRRVTLAMGEHSPIVAKVDSGKLHQIVQNLVRNGLEATPEGGHVQVAVSNGAPNAFHIVVTDDGPGIPEDVLPRIYEPFFSTKESGTGMGMAIVHSLVAMHGGRIEIGTSPEGTTLDVELPRQ